MKRFRWAALVTAFLLVAAACGGDDAVTTTAASATTTTASATTTTASATTTTAVATVELESVELWGSRDPQSMAEVVIASEKGFFDEEGVNVEVKFVQFGSDIPPAVAGGDVDIGKQAGIGITIIALATPVVTLVRTSNIAGGIGVLAHPDSDITTIKDLEGKTVGMPATPPLLDGFKRLLAFYDTDFDEVNIVNLLPQDAVVAFQAGDLDAAFVPEPALTTLRDAGGVLLHTGEVSWLDGTPQPVDINWTLPDALFATKEFVDANPNTVLAIMRGMKKGIDYIHENPEDAARILAEPMNSTEAIMLTSFDEFLFVFDFDDKTLGTPMDELAAVFVEEGIFDSAPLFVEYGDPSFLEQIDPGAVNTTMFDS